MNKKLFRGAFLEAILLNFINSASGHGVHGYAIYKAIQKRFDVRLGPSTLYPELKLLEKRELIESSWDFRLGKARRVYHITKKGRNLLCEYSAELKVVVPSFATLSP